MAELPMACDKDMPPYHVVVRFGRGVPSDWQSRTLFAMEKTLRENGVPAEVFKETMADDSKLRSRMTEAERAKL